MRGLFAIVAATACFGAPAAASAQEFVYDPYEGFNRRMFAVHEALDENIFEPIARGYRAVTPRPVRTGVSNVLRNLSAPVTFANDVLQGEGERAATTFARFGVNTTIGLFGVFDPATEFGLESHSEDFGQTLAVWGVPSGPYLFLPVIGPTNFRDGPGRIVDFAFQPLTYASFEGEEAVRAVRLGATAVSARESVLEAVDDLRDTSFDPYVSYRSSYGLFRYSAIQNGRRDVLDLPEFEEIPAYDDGLDAAASAPDAQEHEHMLEPEAAPEPTEPPVVGDGDVAAEGAANTFQIGELQ